MELEHAGYGNPIMSVHATGSTGGTAGPSGIPEKPGLEGLEATWSSRWEENGTYAFDRTASREDVFSIDTPPPTVSGSLHIGHVFSYTHTDAVARFHRMRGRAVFYPMGWDDNGLPTERRVQNYFGVRCDPGLPFDPNFEPPAQPGKEPISISRPNFVALCHRLTAEDEQVFEHLWRTLGLSVDWSHTYATVSDRAQLVSQRGFLRLAARGQVVQRTAPTLWDVDFRTAVSQAELEDRDRPGAYHRLRFPRVGAEGAVEIETTRPELLPACVALVAHPDDERYRPLFGTEVATPLFGARVPVLAHQLADPEKGSGIAMICTFGDTTDVVWWRELRLPTRTIVGRDGRLLSVDWGTEGWGSDDPGRAAQAYGELAGRTVKPGADADRRAADRVRATSSATPAPITHPVKFYEKGDRPLEIVSSRQWFVRTLAPPGPAPGPRGGAALAPALHGATATGPGSKGSTATGTSAGSGSSACRSRSGTRSTPTARPTSTVPIFADEDRLPVDPSTDVPDGYTEDQRGPSRAGSSAIRTSWTPGPRRR